MFPHGQSTERTVAASIILAGDETLAKRLHLHVMAPVKTRMTCFFSMESLNENETEQFVSYRLDAAKAPTDLFDSDTISLISSHCRGNRRQIMNIGTLLLDEAYFRQEKTIASLDHRMRSDRSIRVKRKRWGGIPANRDSPAADCCLFQPKEA
jgi:type II secretory pathway predicted ATPase ExeA